MKGKLFYGGILLSTVLSFASHFLSDSSGIRFATSALAVVFLAALLGKATESVAHYAGERIGGFLNATFGNAAELIIAIFLVKEGMFSVVKASLTGSIIGNLLLVLGLSVFAGGLKYKTQKFNVVLAEHNASLMLLGVIALFVPAIFASGLEPAEMNTMSLVVAGGLIISYILWLAFSMITHKDHLVDEVAEGHDEEEHVLWGKSTSIIVMLVATIFVAIESEWLVHSIEGVSKALGWTELFVGAFVIAIVGNAAEHSAAVFLALKNKIGTSVEIAIGSSLQIALFVGPLLVFISYLLGNPMDIVFSTYELVAIGVSVFITKAITRDGTTNWFEGILLLIVYVILGTAFYFL